MKYNSAGLTKKGKDLLQNNQKETKTVNNSRHTHEMHTKTNNNFELHYKYFPL